MFKFGKDEKECSGCRVCQLICALHNKEECDPGKSFLEVQGSFPEPGGYKVRILKGCTLCGECLAICPTGALFKKEVQP